MMSVSGKVFEQYTQDVYNWAYRLLGHHHDALDVVQEVFLRWDRQCHREMPRQPRGWLRRVTLNRVVDFLRGRQSSLVATNETQEPSSMKVSQAEAVDRAVLRADIQNALDRLTEQQRSVLIAKVYDEMSFARIAEELSLAVPTVKTHYLRAVRVVRDRLQRRWAKEES
ncbi:MAG: sigma-70 family RNA polymerase sigma factor [Phycisphaerales bacterium]|nr:sigma-70 family RNA polymerase sigma factor [Phycisphaerales bacterium]